MTVYTLLIFNKDLQEGCEHQQKQSLLLVLKMRYLAAQFLALFRNNLWEKLASQANQKAREIVSIIEANPAFRITAPVETNQIFFTAPPELIPYIQEKINCYLWTAEISELRFVTSWNTSDDDVGMVRKIFKGLK